MERAASGSSTGEPFEAEPLGALGGLPLATGPFRRGVTEPHSGRATLAPPAAADQALADLDAVSLNDATPHRRAVTEPVPTRRGSGPSLVLASFAVDTVLLPGRPEPRRELRTWVLNGVLCLVSLVTSCLYPVLVDLSRTATTFGPDGAERRRLPYSVLSILQAEALFNVALGVLVMAATQGPSSYKVLLRLDTHRMMLPLTSVYCMGDVASLCAISHGGGLLYTAVANSRLLFAAAVSQVLLGRRQTPWQWTVLSGICLATVAYASLGASGRSSAADGPSGYAQATAGTFLALWKAMSSGLAAVLTESRYKHLDLWQANTLLKAQSLAVALAAGALRAAAVEDTPLCPSEPWCVDRLGWDWWTWGVLAVEIGAGWLSVAVLTRMSAVAKFICKTATAPSLYLFYIATGFRDVRFELQSFLAVLAIAAGILAYTHLEALRKAAEATWVDEYTTGPARPAPSAFPRPK